MKTIYVVVVLGYWGKGATLKEAAQNCYDAGASKRDHTVVYQYTGSEQDIAKVEVDGCGGINYPIALEVTKVNGIVDKVSISKLIKG